MAAESIFSTFTFSGTHIIHNIIQLFIKSSLIDWFVGLLIVWLIDDWMIDCFSASLLTCLEREIPQRTCHGRVKAWGGFLDGTPCRMPSCSTPDDGYGPSSPSSPPGWGPPPVSAPENDKDGEYSRNTGIWTAPEDSLMRYKCYIWEKTIIDYHHYGTNIHHKQDM